MAKKKQKILFTHHVTADTPPDVTKLKKKISNSNGTTELKSLPKKKTLKQKKIKNKNEQNKQNS